MRTDFLINNTVSILGCNISDDLSLNCTNKYHNSFYDSINISYKLPLGFLMTIISVTAIFGNALVIAAFIREKSLRTVIYFFKDFLKQV